MENANLRAGILGFGGVIGVFAVLFYFAGFNALLTTLRGANSQDITLVVLAVFGWLISWSVSLKIVLHTLDIDLSYPGSFFIFAGAMFSNNVTPFGQAGGEPIAAYLISQSVDAEYERGLAAIASVDALNFIPSITIALTGVSYFATEVALSANDGVLFALIAVVSLAVSVPTLAYGGWQRRQRIKSKIADWLVPLVQAFSRRIPRLSVPEPAGIIRRIERFFQAIERVATQPKQLAMALTASTLGWTAQMIALWLAFQAVGVSIRLSIALIVVPIAAIAGATPLPGGAGGIETALVVLLMAAPLPDVSKAIIVAAVVIFRSAVYWIPIFIGGGVVAWIGSVSRIN